MCVPWHQHILVRHRRHSKWCSGRIQVFWCWVTHVWFWWIIYQNRNSKHHTISGLSVFRFVTWRWVFYIVEIMEIECCVQGKRKCKICKKETTFSKDCTFTSNHTNVNISHNFYCHVIFHTWLMIPDDFILVNYIIRDPVLSINTFSFP